MDTVLRTYAHTAWTPADPLGGLDPEVRRAILLMPSTWRERWKMAPWTSRHQRRAALMDIIAERRLRYDLEVLPLATPRRAPSEEPTSAAAQVSPYYAYRMQALKTMRAARAEQDADDVQSIPEARADRDQRATRFAELMAIRRERARLDLREDAILSGHDGQLAPEPRRARPKRAERGRSR